MTVRLALSASIAALVALCSGCAVSTESTETAVEDTFAVTSASALSYYRVEKNGSAYRAKLVNGGTIACPVGGSSSACNVDELELPADCGWECQDGILSFRGVTVLRGKLSTKRVGRRTTNVLTAVAGFDTLVSSIGSRVVYRVAPSSASCTTDPCPAKMKATRLNGTSSPSNITKIDFSASSDPNYVLDPTRGYNQVLSPLGLLVSGTVVNGVLRADRVWRAWTPKPACDTQLSARDHFFHGGEDAVDIEFLTRAEAMTHQDELSRSVHWLVRTSDDATQSQFEGGINDLWAERFTVDKATCAITVTGEH